MYHHHVLSELSIFDVTLAGGWLYRQDLRSFVNVTHVVIFGVLGSRQRSTQAPSSAKSWLPFVRSSQINSMSFNAFIHSFLRRNTTNDSLDERSPYEVNASKLGSRLWDVFERTYDLGFTCFGGPPVHFQIFHRKFVDGLGKTPWIDEQTVTFKLTITNQLLHWPLSIF